MSAPSAPDEARREVVVIDMASLPGNTSGEEMGSFDGAGTLEMLDVIKILEASDITCCMVGTGALKYYGAGRVLQEWEICVPSDKLQRAAQILTSRPYDQVYEQCPPRMMQVYSMHHSFPLLKLKGVTIWFYLVPSNDCHFDCLSSNIEYSKMGLPYPKLHVFAQSLLDTLDKVSLTDLVDGMDLDNEWGSNHLDLSGTQDIAWIKWKNEEIIASSSGRDLFVRNSEPCSVKVLWNDIVDGKTQRIGPECAPGVLVTRFRVAGQGDPREMERCYV